MVSAAIAPAEKQNLNDSRQQATRDHQRPGHQRGFPLSRLSRSQAPAILGQHSQRQPGPADPGRSHLFRGRRRDRAALAIPAASRGSGAPGRADAAGRHLLHGQRRLSIARGGGSAHIPAAAQSSGANRQRQHDRHDRTRFRRHRHADLHRGQFALHRHPISRGGSDCGRRQPLVHRGRAGLSAAFGQAGPAAARGDDPVPILASLIGRAPHLSGSRHERGIIRLAQPPLFCWARSSAAMSPGRSKPAFIGSSCSPLACR